MSNVEREDERGTSEYGAPSPTPNAQHPTPTTSSRRDFLRRASQQAVKEAVEIGTKVVPGGAIVRQFVERADRDDANDADDALYDPLAIPEKKPAPVILKNPLGWFAAWRKGRSGGGDG